MILFRDILREFYKEMAKPSDYADADMADIELSVPIDKYTKQKEMEEKRERAEKDAMDLEEDGENP